MGSKERDEPGNCEGGGDVVSLVRDKGGKMQKRKGCEERGW